jgi:GNAT superfamily N-acetyltransferase
LTDIAADALYADITSVVPDHRRRKIATALKVFSAKYALEQGYHYIETDTDNDTDNEEDNPMYTLNLKLGFEPLPAWVYYKKELELHTSK